MVLATPALGKLQVQSQYLVLRDLVRASIEVLFGNSINVGVPLPKRGVQRTSTRSHMTLGWL